MDTQTTGVMGRNWLVSQLVWDVGLEVARPERDHGVDLIAYLDLDETDGEFVACPIQMKAATAASFSVSAKYGKFSRLLMVYVWHVGELYEATCAFALSYAEALAVADIMGYTVTPSWAEGAYSTTEPSRRLRELLEPYRMGPGDWYRKVDQLGHS